MRITSGIDFLQSKKKFWMDDESPGFSSTIFTILTINAISEKFVEKVSFHKTFQDSENQASRYMLQDKDLGLGNQDSCPWRECKTNRTTQFWRLFPMNWEVPSVLRRGSSLPFSCTSQGSVTILTRFKGNYSFGMTAKSNAQGFGTGEPFFGNVSNFSD
jgi:hypothetical protein